MNKHIFLSASIPIPGREPFDRDVQIKRIRDAILAIVTVCRDRDLGLVFGGHPAISPLVHHAADSLGVVKNVCIYQSEHYRHSVPEAARKFPNLRWTKAGTDDSSSQAIMRDQMINSKEWAYSDALFVGGMEGIFDEARRFHDTYDDKPMIPLRETGGATRTLMEKVDPNFTFLWKVPENEVGATSMLRYRALLDKVLTAA